MDGYETMEWKVLASSTEVYNGLYSDSRKTFGLCDGVNKEQIRLLTIHEWLLGSDATVESERINLAWGIKDSWQKYHAQA
ncbi:hypothetical protein KIN20_012841 [Parelaphostrongylus tenuis]|uniref:Uncharacterized protein n=1 Tax=Parelaphostrongylus tenuis TaxID=148309 RepID=A0AAD5MXG6_PARTN|nr:hypothetical protein KIN20_012841 [Parelaphostrongylus tenuis]